MSTNNGMLDQFLAEMSSPGSTPSHDEEQRAMVESTTRELCKLIEEAALAAERREWCKARVLILGASKLLLERARWVHPLDQQRAAYLLYSVACCVPQDRGW